MPVCATRYNGDDRRALARGIAGRGDDRRSLGHALQDLDAIAVVAPDGDLLQVHGLVGLDDRDLGAVGAEQNRGRGHDERRVGTRAAQIHFGVGSGKQRAVGVRHVDLDEHRAAGGIERLRGARDGAAETPARKMRHRQRRRLADVDRVHAALRDVDIRPKRTDLRDPVEQCAAGADEGADVHVAHRDDTVERRLDDAVALHLLQARAVGLDRGKIAALREDRLLERLHVGVLRGQLRLILIAVLLRRNALLDEHLHAFGRDAREIAVRLALHEGRLRLLHRCLRLLDGRLRLVHLLIELRRVDFGEDLSRLHTVADIGEAAFEVPVGPGKNRRLGERLHRAGKFQHVLVRGAAHLHHHHARQALLLRLGLRSKRRLPALQRQVAGKEGDDAQHQQPEQQR